MHQSELIAGLISGALAVLGQLLIAVKQSGANETKIAQNSQDIGEIKEEQIRQWSTIGDHGERIGRLEGRR